MDLRYCYGKQKWAACICMVFPLLDSLVRSYFGSDDLRATVQLFRDAFFEHANLTVASLVPPGQLEEEFAGGRVLVVSKLDDLRIIGVYLVSFFEIANRIYAWHDSSVAKSGSKINRHAFIHGAAISWTHADAVRLITFLDLALRLEDVLRILAAAEPEIE